MKKPKDLKVAVVGVGFMGHHHARILTSLPGTELVAVADTDHKRAISTAHAYLCKAYSNVSDMLDCHPELDAIIIAVPTLQHAQVAAEVIRRGIPCLIEKPLASTLIEAQEIVALASNNKTLVQVGHIERFNPAVKAIMDLEIDPIFIKIDRVSPMPFRSLDVNVVMDIMIHDLDLILMLTKSKNLEVEVEALGVGLKDSPIHLAQARIKFQSGCLADLTASRIALKAKRQIRIFTRESYLSVDCLTRQATFIRFNEYLAALDRASDLIDQGTELSEDEVFQLTKIDILTPPGRHDRDYQLRSELIDFLAAVKGRWNASVDINDGLRAVELAELVIAKMTCLR